jgi:hypothetical protein
MGSISIDNKVRFPDTVAWQYFEELDKIKATPATIFQRNYT